MKRKKNTRLSLVIIGIILFIAGLSFAIPSAKDLSGINGKTTDFKDITPDNLEDGMYVEGSIQAVYGCFAEYEETTNYFFKRTTEKYYYVDITPSADSYTLIGLGEKASKCDDLDAMSDEFDAYTNSGTYVNLDEYGNFASTKTFKFKGKLKNASGDLLKYLEQNGNGAYASTEPYYIEVISASSCTTLIILGVALCLLGITLFVICIFKKKPAATVPNINPYTPDANNNGYTNAYDGGANTNPYTNPYTGNDSTTPYNNPYAAGNGNTNSYNNPYAGNTSPYSANPAPNGMDAQNFQPEAPTVAFTEDSPTISLNDGLDESTFSLKK